MILPFSTESVYALHDNGAGWGQNTDQNYYCTYEINSKLDTTSSISDACDDLTESVAHWNNISGSELTFTESSYSSTTINLWTQPFSTTIAGVAYGVHTDPFVEL